MLVPYYLTRYDCASCGTFETGTQDRPDLASMCPWCDGELKTTAQCRGMTSRRLPFTSDPHLEPPVRGTSIDQINEQSSDNRRRRHGNGKSTGRKRAAAGNRDRQEYDHERYLRSKKDGRPHDFDW